MGYSVILVDTLGKVVLGEYLKQIEELENIETIFCTNKQIETENESFKCVVFENGTDAETVINKVAKMCSKENIIIVRDVSRLGKLNKLISKHKKFNEIVCPMRELVGIKKFWGKIQHLVGKIFNKDILPIDYGIMLYGAVPSRVIKNVANPSALTRVNSFTGMEYVFIDGGEKYKFAYNKKKAGLKTFVPMFVGVVMIVLKLAINFNMFTTLEAVYYFVAVFAIVIGLLFGGKWIVLSSIGEVVANK